MIEIPFWDRNENKSKELIKKIHEYTKNKVKISIKCITKKKKKKKVTRFFLLKVKDM